MIAPTKCIDPGFGDYHKGQIYEFLRPSLDDVLCEITKENLLVDRAVFLNATSVRNMLDAKFRDRLAELVVETGSKLKIVRWWCSDATLRRRIEERRLPETPRRSRIGRDSLNGSLCGRDSVPAPGREHGTRGLPQ